MYYQEPLALVKGEGAHLAYQTYGSGELDILAVAPGAKSASCPANAFHSPARKQ